MGRKKIKIKKIENDRQKTVTFTRRRSGLIKKAHELSVLCDCDVVLLMFDAKDNCHVFSSAANADDLIEKYRNKDFRTHEGRRKEETWGNSFQNLVNVDSLSSVGKVAVVNEYNILTNGEGSENISVRHTKQFQPVKVDNESGGGSSTAHLTPMSSHLSSLPCTSIPCMPLPVHEHPHGMPLSHHLHHHIHPYPPPHPPPAHHEPSLLQNLANSTRIEMALDSCSSSDPHSFQLSEQQQPMLEYEDSQNYSDNDVSSGQRMAYHQTLQNETPRHTSLQAGIDEEYGMEVFPQFGSLPSIGKPYVDWHSDSLNTFNHHSHELLNKLSIANILGDTPF